MKRWIFFLVLVSISPVGHAQDTVRMDQVAQYYFNTDQFMGTVLVARGESILFEKNYGYANFEWNTEFTPDTRFRLGSITKQFTAASILLLEERGKLSVTDHVKKYVPDAPPAWDNITLHHLLSHTSGIPNFTEFPEFNATRSLPSTPEKTIARFRDKPLDFSPGEKYKYSNSGYILLGYIIEKVAGKPYTQFLQENIFTPLALNETGYEDSNLLPHRAAGYMAVGPKKFVNAGWMDPSVPFSAGALYSSARDLLKWEQALFSGRLLSAASLKKMTTPVKDDYGYGLWIHTADGYRDVSHGGSAEGFNADMRYYPDEKITVIVLSNVMGPAWDIGSRLGKIAHAQPIVIPTDRKEVAVSPEILRNYVGQYQISPEFGLAITFDQDHLMLQGTGQPQIRLFAETDTKFFLRAVEADLVFAKDSDGKVTHATLLQGGQQIKCVRQ